MSVAQWLSGEEVALKTQIPSSPGQNRPAPSASTTVQDDQSVDTASGGGASVAGVAGRQNGSRMHRIAERAHEIYERRGGENGKALDDWLQAEREIDEET
jgi:Protein of unknown function (DUF2934)